MYVEQTIAALNVAVGPAHGPPLVMLHGVCRNWTDFVSLAPGLSTRWQLYLVDQRGHGQSPRYDRYLVTDYVDDAVRLIEQLEQPVVLYGHSLGAMVAAGAAARLAQQVRGIVLEDPPFHSMGRQMAGSPLADMFGEFRTLRLQHAGESSDSEAVRIAQLASGLADVRVGGARLGDIRDAASFPFAARCMLKMDPAVLDPVVEGRWLDGYDPAQVAQAISCPLLLLHADQQAGGMLSDADVAMLYANAPQTLVVPMPGIGHLVHATSSDLVLRHVWPFLESI